MGAVSPGEATRAHKIRTRLRKKKPITRADYAWLEGYERTTGAPVKCPAPVFEAPAPTPFAAAPQPVPSAASSIGTTEQPAGAEEGPAPIVLPGLEAPPPPPPKEEAPPKEKPPHVSIGIDGIALVGMLVETMRQYNGKLRDEFPDAFILPDFYFQKIMLPCATDLARKYMPDVDFSDDFIEAGVVILGVGATFGQVHVLRARARKEHGGQNGGGRPIYEAPQHPMRDQAPKMTPDGPPPAPDTKPIGPDAVMDGGGGGVSELSTFINTMR